MDFLLNMFPFYVKNEELVMDMSPRKKGKPLRNFIIPEQPGRVIRTIQKWLDALPQK